MGEELLEQLLSKGAQPPMPDEAAEGGARRGNKPHAGRGGGGCVCVLLFVLVLLSALSLVLVLASLLPLVPEGGRRAGRTTEICGGEGVVEGGVAAEVRRFVGGIKGGTRGRRTRRGRGRGLKQQDGIRRIVGKRHALFGGIDEVRKAWNRAGLSACLGLSWLVLAWLLALATPLVLAALLRAEAGKSKRQRHGDSPAYLEEEETRTTRRRARGGREMTIYILYIFG